MTLHPSRTTMLLLRSRPLQLLLAAAGSLLAACSGSQVEARTGSGEAVRTAAEVPAATEAPQDAGADAALLPFRAELLDLAFRAASALPVDPFVKNRSRAQESVVAVCLELDQPQRALRCIAGIDNWRRGAGYADYACWCAARGMAQEAQRCLELAAQIADESQRDENAQEWRRDRIRAKIARAHVLLGSSEEAAPLLEGLPPAERAPASAARLGAGARIDDEVLDAELAVMDRVLAAGGFDQLQSCLEVLAGLFEQCYADAGRRARIEQRIAVALQGLPAGARIDAAGWLLRVALEHGDRTHALEIATEASGLMDTLQWQPEQRIAAMAQLAVLQHRVGVTDEARRTAGAALARFEADRARIFDVFRGRALRPLAEAMHALGDGTAALALYGRALEEGLHNPNSRPRAEDLVAICCSMARHGVEPDGALRARLQAACAALGTPW